jgi:Transposase DDE domain
VYCQSARQWKTQGASGLRRYQQAASEGKLKHLGVPTAPSRSTLAYAHQHRPWQLYQTGFLELLNRCQALAHSGKRKFRFKNKLLSLDATVIDLCATLYDWAKFRRTKGAIKLHLLLDHDGYLPRFAVITDGKTHELNVARMLRWEPGTILVFDRGYVDYQWFVELTRQGVYWVTRLKENADYLVVERRPVPAGGKVLADEAISFYRLPGEGREYFFRRVEIWDAEQERRLVLLSNHLEFGPTTLAEIYKERWQVELFFESSTWCTPSYVMEFQESFALNRPLLGSLYGSVRPYIAPRLLGA